MITDIVGPYVDHVRPFDGLGVIRERFESQMDLQFDDADAFFGRGDGR